MDKKEVLKQVLDRVSAAEAYRKRFEPIWEQAYQRWRNYVDSLIDPLTGREDLSRSNFGIPYTFVQVETIVPRLVEAMFAARPYVTVRGRTPDDQAGAQANELLLDWEMNERMSFQRLFHAGLKSLVVYGTAVAYTGWKYERRQVGRWEPAPAMLDGVPVLERDGRPVLELQQFTVNELAYDDPEVKFLSLKDFFVDPLAEDIDGARFCGHEEYLTGAQLQEREQLGLYEIDWSKAEAVPLHDEPRHGWSSEEKESADPDIDYYEVLHYWEDYRHVVLLNRNQLICDEENPFWHSRKPYDRGVYTLVPGEFYGIGIPELLGDLQQELNMERNMLVDYRKFLLRRMWKVRKSSGIRKSDLKWEAGGVVMVNDLDDIGEIGVTDASASAFTAIGQAKQDMQEATGGHDVVMGISDRRETATSTVTKEANAGVRFKLIVSALENDLLVPVARKMMQLNQQYLLGPKWLRVTEMGKENYRQVKFEEIQGEFDLLAMGSSVEPLADKEAHREQLLELLRVLGPQLAGHPDQYWGLIKLVLEAYGIKDTNRIIPQ